MIIERSQIIDKLNSINDYKDLENLQEWAENIYFPGELEFDDWEEENSVSNIIMGTLETLAMNLMIKEDIKYYIDFLKTPKGKFQEGYNKWDNYLKSINYEERKALLRNNPLYMNYCK